MPVAAPPLWRLRPQPAQSGRGERRGGGQSRAGRRTSSPPGPGRSRLSWVHLFWTLPPKFLSLRFGGPDQCGRGSARMRLAASAERTGGASAVEASGPESVRSSLSWVHFVLDSPSKVLFHPVRVGFSGYGGGFSGERREQTGGLQRLWRRVLVCAERSVLGTFVLDSPSKVPFTSFWGPWPARTGFSRAPAEAESQ